MATWSEWFSKLDQTMPRGWSQERDSWAPFARWANTQEIQQAEWVWRESDPTLLLGRYDGTLIGRKGDDRHVLTVAGTRAGKGRSLILPNLATWPGAVVAIDPKGELARKTGRTRGALQSQPVVVLDPFGVSGWKTQSYNPLGDLDPNSPTFVDDVALVADALILESGGERHWTDSARNLVRGLILYLFATGGEVSLPRLRRVLLGAEGRLGSYETVVDGEHNIFVSMAASDSFDGLLSLTGWSFLQKTNEEFDSILSTAREQLAFLDVPAMAAVLRPSSISLKHIKRRPMTVYLCLPATRLVTQFRWLRVVINLTLAALEDDYEPQCPALLLLEEFAVLGHMGSIEKAAGQMAGFGVKLWTILQDLGQLKAIYKDRWETFMGNAGVTTWFGLNDLTSLEYVSKRLGDTHFVRMEKVDLTMSQKATGAAEYRENIVSSRLLTPEEVGRLLSRETGRILILHPGSRPAILQRIDAADSMFRGKIDGERG